MTEKYNYVGIVEGLRKNLNETSLVKSLCAEMRQFGSRKNEKKEKFYELFSKFFERQFNEFKFIF